MYKAKKCLLAEVFLPKSACEAGSFGERSAPCSHGPGTSEASALSSPQAKNFGLGARSAPRSRGPGTSEASVLSLPQAKNFGLFTVCKTLRCNLVIEFSF